MKKLLSLVAVLALLASVEAEARHCGRRSCDEQPRVAAPCPVQCEVACEMNKLPDMVECEEKPVCKTIVCGVPRKVCTEQKIVRCHWVCPPNCATFASEEEANQHDFTNGAKNARNY